MGSIYHRVVSPSEGVPLAMRAAARGRLSGSKRRSCSLCALPRELPQDDLELFRAILSERRDQQERSPYVCNLATCEDRTREIVAHVVASPVVKPLASVKPTFMLVAPVHVHRATPAAARAPAAQLAAPFIGEGVAFFNNLRVPAALVAAAAIKDAFALQSAPEDIKQSRGWTLMRNAYLMLQISSFSSELTCIFIATQAITALQMASVDILNCQSLREVLTSCMEYEYVGARAGFATGLLAFTVAQALRVRYALRRQFELSVSAMWFMLSASASLLMYSNANTISYGGYPGLLKRWAVLHSQLLISRLRVGYPVAIIALFSLLASAIIGARILWKLLLDEADTDRDGTISFAEALAISLRGPRAVADVLKRLKSSWLDENDAAGTDAQGFGSQP